jgi:alpha-L-rhamnosidase
MRRAGAVSTSNETVNRLYQNIVWGQRGNYLEVPTDCPQRDERLGWTGDAQIFIRTGTFNYDAAAFFTKWMRDLFDAQTPDGYCHVVAPMPPGDVIGAMWSGAWADAAIICPWTMHRVYGDTRIVRRYYPQMKLYMDFLRRHSKDLLLPAEGFGDWVSLHADTPKDLLNTAYFAYDAQLMAEMAEAIGEAADAKEYRRLFADIREAFLKKYLKDEGRLEGNTQTAYVLALRFGLLPQDKAEEVRKLQVPKEGGRPRLACFRHRTNALGLAL